MSWTHTVTLVSVGNGSHDDADRGPRGLTICPRYSVQSVRIPTDVNRRGSRRFLKKLGIKIEQRLCVTNKDMSESFYTISSFLVKIEAP